MRYVVGKVEAPSREQTMLENRGPLANFKVLCYSRRMTTCDTSTNSCDWDHILKTMTYETSYSSRRLAAVGGFRSNYYAPKVNDVRRVRTRRRIVWSRIVLPLLALSCLSVYRANVNAEKQYQDDLQTTYRSVGVK